MGTYLLRDFGLLSQTPWRKWLLKIPSFPWLPLAWSLPASWQGQGRSLSTGVFWVLVWANTVKVSEVWSWKLLQEHWLPSLPALYLGSSGHCGVKKIRLKRLWLTAEKQGRYTGLESKAGIIWQMFRKTAELRIIQFVFKKKSSSVETVLIFVVVLNDDVQNECFRFLIFGDFKYVAARPWIKAVFVP